MQPCQLNYVAREDVLRLLQEHADRSFRALQQLARDCSDSYGVVRAIGLSLSVSERFARFLLETSADGEVRHTTDRCQPRDRHPLALRVQEKCHGGTEGHDFDHP